MEWMTLQWFSFAVIAGLLGLVGVLTVRALNAGASEPYPSEQVQKLSRRLQDCETLLTEVVQCISKIEARDKMRRVRAGVPAAAEAVEPAPGEKSTLSSLPTAEIRRRIASRVPIT